MCGFYGWNPCCCRPVVCCPQPSQTTLSGLVSGVDGLPVANFPIAFTINGIASMTTTDANGRYTIIAPQGATVVITPQPAIGVVANPTNLTLTACQNRMDLNFVLTAV